MKLQRIEIVEEMEVERRNRRISSGGGEEKWRTPKDESMKERKRSLIHWMRLFNVGAN